MFEAHQGACSLKPIMDTGSILSRNLQTDDGSDQLPLQKCSQRANTQRHKLRGNMQWTQSHFKRISSRNREQRQYIKTNKYFPMFFSWREMEVVHTQVLHKTKSYLSYNPSMHQRKPIVLVWRFKPACIGSIIWLFYVLSAFYVHMHLGNSETELLSCSTTTKPQQIQKTLLMRWQFLTLLSSHRQNGDG